MEIGVLKEKTAGETRVAMAPETVKKMTKTGLILKIEKGAGLLSGFPDEAFLEAGAQLVSASEAAQSPVVLKIRPPQGDEISLFPKDSLLISLMDAFDPSRALEPLAARGVHAYALELIPRTSRAQSMDVLSSQANIAGYRAVLEAAVQYPRFFPMMMTSAGMARPAKLSVLGVGVAGLQAIATARRLGPQVDAFDVRPEVKEQILSLGAKVIDLGIDEDGAGEGGYAKALSEEGQKRQQKALAEKLMKVDVVISTANIPGRRAPVLITEEAVQGMRPGSVIIDMAAANGGNCPLSKPDEVIEVNGVKIVGWTNYPAMVPADASRFFGQNLQNLLALFIKSENGRNELVINLEDDIVEGGLAVFQGDLRKGKR